MSGADSHLAIENVRAIARNQTQDEPGEGWGKRIKKAERMKGEETRFIYSFKLFFLVLFFYALIGDDICDPKHESGWTTPQEFRQNVLETLDFLNTTLPHGSDVVLVGM